MSARRRTEVRSSVHESGLPGAPGGSAGVLTLVPWSVAGRGGHIQELETILELLAEPSVQQQEFWREAPGWRQGWGEAALSRGAPRAPSLEEAVQARGLRLPRLQASAFHPGRRHVSSAWSPSFWQLATTARRRPRRMTPGAEPGNILWIPSGRPLAALSAAEIFPACPRLAETRSSCHREAASDKNVKLSLWPLAAANPMARLRLGFLQLGSEIKRPRSIALLFSPHSTEKCRPRRPHAASQVLSCFPPFPHRPRSGWSANSCQGRRTQGRLSTTRAGGVQYTTRSKNLQRPGASASLREALPRLPLPADEVLAPCHSFQPGAGH
ncbi:uncharacterized protein LOC129145156 isoform X2 [Talpa occidentalis]|uniref:uncharacterized protein LOC129145156 isoform X2 n=1 Tax=Talpa occidentalis TaxID=50954 RepID=UPI0023F8F836|nr:uncharacterized protein LOC129145156 isoform X2 [Talpa occidentalis]